MASNQFYKSAAPVLYILLFVCSACSTTAPTQYYLLTPALASVAGTTGHGDPILISLGPVTLPEYLDRTQIVTRHTETELRLAYSHRWAEPLQENFTRVLAENLYNLMGAGRVIVYPAREYTAIDYRVAIDVTRFDASDRGEVLLIATWSIYDSEKKNLLDSRRSEYRQSAGPGAGYPEFVAALSGTVNQLSRDIHSAIAALKR